MNILSVLKSLFYGTKFPMSNENLRVSQVIYRSRRDPKEASTVARNLKGIRLENRDKIQEAIQLYEENVREKFDGSHPYERLRIIYRSQKRYEDAIRVCQAYIVNGQQDPVLKSQYAKDIEDFQEKIKKTGLGSDPA